jgi:hypothetical protein
MGVFKFDFAQKNADISLDKSQSNTEYRCRYQC